MADVEISYKKFELDVTVNITKKSLDSSVTNEEVVKYLKGVFTNKTRFENRFINEVKGVRATMQKMLDAGELEKYTDPNPADFECEEFMDEILAIYDEVEAYTYSEAFNIEDQRFQIKVFGSIDITEMIAELGHERIKVEGIAVKHKQFTPEGEFTGYKEYDSIYEIHKVNGEKLKLEEDLYALKCWCTTTKKAHWLWIEDQYKDDPLAAVASTFRIHENLIPHIKELKRQGDVLLVEMKEDVAPEGEIVPLNKDQYFSLLTAQS